LKWDTIIEEKTSELGRFLVGKSSDIDFVEPAPKLLRLDDHELRDGILALTQSKARELGIGKSTFHYLRNNAKNDQPFKCYRKVLTRLSATSVDEC
jgi:CRISPR-associated protein Cas1